MWQTKTQHTIDGPEEGSQFLHQIGEVWQKFSRIVSVAKAFLLELVFVRSKTGQKNRKLGHFFSKQIDMINGILFQGILPPGGPQTHLRFLISDNAPNSRVFGPSGDYSAINAS